MKHYLLVRNRKVGDTGTLPVSGKVHDADTVEDAISFLENGELLSAVILDMPSEISGVRELISNINDRNIVRAPSDDGARFAIREKKSWFKRCNRNDEYSCFRILHNRVQMTCNHA